MASAIPAAVGTEPSRLEPEPASVSANRCDFNGDGYEDLAIRLPGFDVGAAPDAGAVDILCGSPHGIVVAGGHRITEAATGNRYSEAGDLFGFATACGDVNADGYADLLGGSPGEDNAAGRIHLIRGSKSGLQAERSTALSAPGGAAGDRFGATVLLTALRAGNRDKVIAGAPGYQSEKGSVVVFKRNLRKRGNLVANPSSAAAFGASLASGDINNNGRADVAVGAPGGGHGSVSILFDLTVAGTTQEAGFPVHADGMGNRKASGAWCIHRQHAKEMTIRGRVEGRIASIGFVGSHNLAEDSLRKASDTWVQVDRGGVPAALNAHITACSTTSNRAPGRPERCPATLAGLDDPVVAAGHWSLWCQTRCKVLSCRRQGSPELVREMRSKNIWVVLTIAAIWLVIIITSLSSPELTFGSEPVVLKPAAIANWFWGLIATVFVLRSTVFRRPDEMGWGETEAWPWIAAVTTVVWLVAMFASSMAPDIVVDETIRVPVAAIVAPPIAVALTLYACEFLITGFASRRPLDAA